MLPMLKSSLSYQSGKIPPKGKCLTCWSYKDDITTMLKMFSYVGVIAWLLPEYIMIVDCDCPLNVEIKSAVTYAITHAQALFSHSVQLIAANAHSRMFSIRPSTKNKGRDPTRGLSPASLAGRSAPWAWRRRGCPARRGSAPAAGGSRRRAAGGPARAGAWE